MTVTKSLTQDIHIKAPLTFTDDTPDGTFIVRFSVFNKIDLQGDVVLPGSIANGQGTTLVWSHDWDTWVGDGVTEVDETGANLRGSFWMDTIDGEQAYRKVKHQGDRCEYSFGFQVTDAEFGEFDGKPVRFVKAVELFEVSPVLIGAMRLTHTIALKSADPTETYADELERLLLRTGEIRALRAKAGRPFSDARRSSLVAIHAELSALLAETEPHALEPDDAKSAASPADPYLDLWFEQQRYNRRRRAQEVLH